MSEFSVRPYRLMQAADETAGAARFLNRDADEVRTILLNLRRQAPFDGPCSRLDALRREAEQRAAALNRLANGLRDIANAYEHCENECSQQVSRDPLLGAAAWTVPLTPLYRPAAAAGLYREEFGGGAQLHWWAEEILGGQAAALLPRRPAKEKLQALYAMFMPGTENKEFFP